MEKYFVNYNQSLALKELGFEKPCIATYTEGAIGKGNDLQWFVSPLEGVNKDFTFVAAPLKSQVFEWFREKHNLISCVRTISYGCAIDEQEFYYEIVSVRGVESYEIYNKYEEAESACIDKLIELCHDK